MREHLPGWPDLLPLLAQVPSKTLPSGAPFLSSDLFVLLLDGGAFAVVCGTGGGLVWLFPEKQRLRPTILEDTSQRQSCPSTVGPEDQVQAVNLSWQALLS